MEIRYKNTFTDLIKFNVYHYPRMLSLQIASLILLVAISWPVFKTWQKTDTPVFALIIGLLINVILCALFMSVFMFVFIVISYLPKLNKGFLTEHKILASETGLIEETDFNRTEHKWSGITKVSQNRHYIFIYTSQHAGHVVPKRTFPDATQAATFFNAIHGWWQTTNRD